MFTQNKVLELLQEDIQQSHTSSTRKLILKEEYILLQVKDFFKSKLHQWGVVLLSKSFRILDQLCWLFYQWLNIAFYLLSGIELKNTSVPILQFKQHTQYSFYQETQLCKTKIKNKRKKIKYWQKESVISEFSNLCLSKLDKHLNNPQ